MKGYENDHGGDGDDGPPKAFEDFDPKALFRTVPRQ